ncbi:MAG: hypothetical protein NTY93_01350, partial [Candidatus Kaiserbacteria bacterium]|nr:hypothetical protein [Candidatus Kaiserbacteria bacterium]
MTKSPEITSKGLENGVAAVSTSKEFDSPAKEIATRKIGEEIVSLRKDNTQVFKAKDGQLTAKIYMSPVNYLDKTDSTYKPIDTSVHQASVASYDSFVDAGVYKATWFTDKPWDYTFYVGDSWIAYKALFSESDALTIKTEALNTGIKETITLKDKTAPTKLQWNVTQSMGKSAIKTLPPTATDANGKEVKVISYQVGDTLTYEVDTTKAAFPIVIDPTTVAAYNGAYGQTRTDNATYSTGRSTQTASYVYTNDFAAGQQLQAGIYYWYRSFVEFYPLPTMSAVSAASLYVYGRYNYNTYQFYIYVLTASQQYDPLSIYDVWRFDGWNGALADTGTILNDSWYSNTNYSSTWNQFTFNAAGRSAVLSASGSLLQLALINSGDYSATAPSGNEYTRFYGPAEAGKVPYLSITYTYTTPSVSTQAVTDVAVTTATGNGNITALNGSENATRRGFCYKVGTSGTPTTADSIVYDDGSFTAGAYTKGLTGLSAGTDYRVRAYAVNASGTGYGSTVQLTTLVATPTVTTQSASSVAATTATLNGNITDIGQAGPTVRGFAYGTDSTLVTVIST